MGALYGCYRGGTGLLQDMSQVLKICFTWLANPSPGNSTNDTDTHPTNYGQHNFCLSGNIRSIITRQNQNICDPQLYKVVLC